MNPDEVLYHVATHATREAVWLPALVIGLLGLLLGHYCRAGLIVTIPLSLFFAWAHLSSVWHPRVGPLVRRDVAAEFLLEWHLAATFALLGPVLGYWWRRTAQAKHRPVVAEQIAAGDVRPGIAPE